MVHYYANNYRFEFNFHPMIKIIRSFFLILFVLTGSILLANNKLDSLQLAYKNADNDSVKIFFLNELSWEFINSNLDSAVFFCEKSLELCKQNDYPMMRAQAYSNQGAIFKRKGEHEKAIDFYIKAFKISEQLNDKKAIANSYINIGSLYRLLRENKKAKENYNKALPLFEELHDTHGIAKVYNQIGNVYADDEHGGEDLDLAIDYYIKSIYLREQLKDQHKIAIGKLSLANVYIKKGDDKNALKTYNEVLEIFKQNSDKKGQAITLSNMSHFLFTRKQYQEAIKKTLQALELGKEIKMVDFVIHCHDQLYYIYTELKNYEEALHHYKIAANMHDSIYNENKLKQFAEMETKYQSEKKEQEIALLNEQNKIKDIKLAQKNSQLFYLGGGVLLVIIIVVLVFTTQRAKASKKEANFARRQAELKQQALRAQMNPHFLFNSLNSIQRIYVEGNMLLANDYMADFSTLLRSILNNSDKEHISLKEDLQMLELYLTMEKVRTNEMVNYEIQIDEGIDLQNTKIAPMLIQPFVENAIWHGILPNKKKGTVKIELNKKGDHMIQCIIKDNGIGIVTSRENKKSQHISKGMQLTNERLGAKGNIIEEELAEGGTKITVNIPVL